ncbi:MAG TPA: methyltransferase domain-containing protein [Gaiellales bacterium]
MSAPASPNADTIEYWNDVLAAKFERFRHVFVGASDVHSRRPLERNGPEPGMRVLDVGCGFGETTLQLAGLVGPGGSAVGTDCCRRFLEVARADARAAGVTNAAFELADAQTAAFEPEFGLAFARFGTMFFADPVAGMRNIRSALAPGGRLLMVVWAPIEDNPWLAFARAVVQRHLPAEASVPVPGPGPFSLSDADVVTRTLTAAGYRDVALERTTAVVQVGASVDEALAFQLTIGPAAGLLREWPEDAERNRNSIETELRAVLEQHARPDGVWMGTSSWAVSALG